MHTKLDFFFLDIHDPGIELKNNKLHQNHGHFFEYFFD